MSPLMFKHTSAQGAHTVGTQQCPCWLLLCEWTQNRHRINIPRTREPEEGWGHQRQPPTVTGRKMGVGTDKPHLP